MRSTHHADSEVGDTKYRETITFKPFGPVDNGTQKLYANALYFGGIVKSTRAVGEEGQVGLGSLGGHKGGECERRDPLRGVL